MAAGLTANDWRCCRATQQAQHRQLIDAFLSHLQIENGYRLEVVTVRKLEFENDAFGFADKIVEKCAFVLHLLAFCNGYPMPKQGDTIDPAGGSVTSIACGTSAIKSSDSTA